MGSHPLNLLFRLLLELVAIVSMGVWGWQQCDGLWQFVLGFGIPISAAAIWGIFAVPEDPSRSGSAPVPIPGILRIILEFLIFASAVWFLFDLGRSYWAFILGGAVISHYLISYDRIVWLIKH